MYDNGFKCNNCRRQIKYDPTTGKMNERIEEVFRNFRRVGLCPTCGNPIYIVKHVDITDPENIMRGALAWQNLNTV